jgi:hypothetical protein
MVIFLFQKKKYSLNLDEDPTVEKEKNSRRKREDFDVIGDYNVLPDETFKNVTNEYFDETLDNATEVFPGDIAYDNVDIADDNVTGSLPESTAAPESTTSYYFEYDDDNNYVWDVFDYHRFEEDEFNLTAFNDTTNTIQLTLSEHYQDPKDKWEALITKFKTTYRNISVYVLFWLIYRGN